MPNKTQFKTHEEYLAWYRNYRKGNKKLREYTRKYNNEWRRKNGYAAEERAREKYPEKEYARKVLQKAVARKQIKRGNCEICNKKNGQGHHDDYYQPLNVRWFCPLHHRQFHKHPSDILDKTS